MTDAISGAFLVAGFECWESISDLFVADLIAAILCGGDQFQEVFRCSKMAGPSNKNQPSLWSTRSATTLLSAMPRSFSLFLRVER